jgi:hypothetical protein
VLSISSNISILGRRDLLLTILGGDGRHGSYGLRRFSPELRGQLLTSILRYGTSQQCGGQKVRHENRSDPIATAQSGCLST